MTASGANKIVWNDVSKEFIQKGNQRVHVLDHISVNVRQNEFLVILGPGQSGKTHFAAYYRRPGKTDDG